MGPPAEMARESELRVQLLLILAIRCMRMALIAQPVLVIWFVDHLGVSVAGMFWLTALGSGFAVLAEIPSGYISDQLGRKYTLMLAFIAMAASFLAAGLAADRLWLLVVFQILKGTGSALFSGTDMALLYETMKRYGRDKGDGALTQESMHIFAITATESVFSVIGGFIAGRYGLQAAVFCAIIPFALSGMLCLAIQEPPPAAASGGSTSSGAKQSQPQREDPLLVKDGFRRALQEAASPSLRTIFIIGMLLNAATYHGVWMHQLLWERAGISTGYFGVLWAALNIAAALSALAATKFRTAVGGGTDRCLVLLCGGTAVAYALMGSPAAVTTFGGGVLLNVVRGLAWPLIGTAINTNISDDRLRATVLSAFSGGSRLVGMASGPAVGRIADRAGLSAACIASGLMFGGTGLLAGIALPGAARRAAGHQKPE